MCGRYNFKTSDSRKGKQLKERARKLNLTYKEGEIFPSDNVLCIIPAESKVDLTTMKWGIQNRSFQINARVESLNDKPSYAEIKNKRCAVICNGFYEWDKEKKKYYIHTDEEFIYLACIFNDANELLILTKASSGEFEKIHHRTPIIMDQDEMLRYIHSQDGLFKPKDLKFEIQDDDLKLF